MGRGHRSGRGGAGRQRGARPGQPTAAPPSGDALRVELRASPEFFQALKGREWPAAPADGGSSSGSSPMGSTALQMDQWKDLDRLLGWFRDGIKADSMAELAFSAKLTKTQRASVHGTATAVGLGGLGTASRGVGEGRCVVVLAKQRAVRPELSEKQDHQAFWTWRWAGQRGLQVSRDEVAEMLLGDGLTPELQAIWDEQSALQKAVQQLCGAVTAGDAAAVAAAADAQPRLLKEGVFDVQTGVAPLHLAAREGRADLVELLLFKGAAVDGLDGHGWTPLQVSRKFEQSDAEGVLLRAGAHDPDKGKSILDKPAASSPVPEPLTNGTKPATPATAAAVAPASASVGSAPLSDAGSQDAYIDSVASVCGTERDNLAAEVGSNADDYADPQYQAASASLSSPAIEEGREGEEADSAAESARAQAEAVALAAKAEAEADAAAAEAAAEEAAAREAAAAAAQSAFAAARAAAAEEEGMGEEGTVDDYADDDDDDEAGYSVDDEGELAGEAAGEAKISAVRAFSAALAAAEAAEAAAVAAESWPGEEGAQRAAAFRREAEAAVAAAAAAAVVVGDALDDVLPQRNRTPPPPPPPSSAASICGSEANALPLLTEAQDPGPGPASSSGSAPAPAPTAESVAASEQQTEAEEGGEAAHQAAAAAGEAALAGGAAAAAAGAAAAAAASEEAQAEPQTPAEAAAGAAGDVHAVASSAAEHTAGAGKGAAAAASWAASRARAELEARAPEWGQWIDQKAPELMQWVQEHPGSVVAGAGIVAAGVAALLYGMRRR
ncbi:hypothetical protein ABPG77_001143 [Micractinium sp. CCAP 211/92]